MVQDIGLPLIATLIPKHKSTKQGVVLQAACSALLEMACR